MEYRYGVLSKGQTEEDCRRNGLLLGENTLGIEVTIPVFAEKCGLGNIDPQHGNGAVRESSAIEAALMCDLPPDGSTLVTIRPDKDSFGAMAVLYLRAIGRGAEIDIWLVAWIGLIDREGFSNAVNLNPELKPAGRETDAIQMLISSTDEEVSLEHRIEAIAAILTNEMSESQINAIAALKKREPHSFEAEVCGEVAFIEASGLYRQARDWGNHNYSVVLVCDPGFKFANGLIKRWTIVRQIDFFDREGFEVEINNLEATAQNMPLGEMIQNGHGWGGCKNIISSSARNPSVLSKEVILDLVIKCTKSGVLS